MIHHKHMIYSLKDPLNLALTISCSGLTFIQSTKHVGHINCVVFLEDNRYSLKLHPSMSIISYLHQDIVSSTDGYSAECCRLNMNILFGENHFHIAISSSTQVLSRSFTFLNKNQKQPIQFLSTQSNLSSSQEETSRP